ncbi:MAG: hypothetical protein HZB65_04485 [Candidatus Aenigmarchaeota archaeon]|nr:hypothetical protein [Candidatus Aenigmarchaeota archaeon]
MEDKNIIYGKCVRNYGKRCVITSSQRIYVKLAHGEAVDKDYDYQNKGCPGGTCVKINGHVKCGYSLASGSIWSTMPEKDRCPPWTVNGKPNPLCFYR